MQDNQLLRLLSTVLQHAAKEGQPKRETVQPQLQSMGLVLGPNTLWQIIAPTSACSNTTWPPHWQCAK